MHIKKTGKADLAIAIVSFMTIAVLVLFISGMILTPKAVPPAPAINGEVCRYLGTGVVEKITRPGLEFNEAGFEIAEVRIIISKAGTNTDQKEWQVMVPAAMRFAKGDLVDLYSTVFQAHQLSNNFTPIIVRLPKDK